MRFAKTVLIGALALLPQKSNPALVFEGARLINGDGNIIEDSAFVVEDGRFVRIGKRGEITIPAGAIRTSIAGKTVMPAIINLHGHLGYADDLSFEAGNYTRKTLVDHLNRYAYYGVGAVLTLGTDPGDLIDRLKAEQRAGTLGGALVLTAGRGIAAPGAGPNFPAMKASAYGVMDEAEGRKAVKELARNNVDTIKVWVDDRNGTVEKLAPNVYRAIIDEAHKQKLMAIAHVFYLADAKELVRAGIDGFAHLVRDREMDQELIDLIRQRNVFVMPNLSGAERRTHATAPSWLNDAALRETVSPQAIKRLMDSYSTTDPAALARAQNTYRNMQRSLSKLAAAGVRIVLGTDSGIPDQFFGYTEQRELELMASAGMTPAQVIQAATRIPAEIMKLQQHGTITAGKSADFIVLDGNPLESITNTRRISKVVLRGKEVDRSR